MTMKTFLRSVPFTAILLIGLAPAVAQPALPGQGPDEGRTVVYRDIWGIPHIYAPTVEAGLYAMGWFQAEDRTEQLLRNFLMGMGELATVDGRGAVQTDTVSRMFEHYAIAKRRAADDINPKLMGHLDAFVDGINAFLAANPGCTHLPVQLVNR
jgi:acyl-homoserine-lactone acylase